MPRIELVSRCIDDVVILAKAEVGSKRLKEVFRSNGLNLDKYPKKFTDRVIDVLSAEFVNQYHISSLEREVDSFFMDSSSVKDFVLIYEMLCYRGLYVLGYRFREKARGSQFQFILSGGKRQHLSLISKAIGGAIESGEKLTLNDDFFTSLKVSANSPAVQKLRYYNSLFVDSGNGHMMSDYDTENEFFRFLNDKKIAVVGPVPTTDLDAKEIDSFDLVVRLNYAFVGKGCDSKHKGLRADITYFNAEQASFFLSDNNGLLPENIQWACFKNKNQRDAVHALNPDKPCRSINMFNDVSFHGTRNMIPLVVMDLCLSKAKQIKIFHTDLMLTAARVAGHYPMSFNRDQKRLIDITRRSSVVHDPLLQYRLLFRLWLVGKIEGDHRFNQVMSMGEKEYLKELQNVYSTCLAL